MYENSGLLSPTADCTCETHSGIPVQGTPPCKAHGVPLGWAHDMSKLHVFPPAYRYILDHFSAQKPRIPSDLCT